MEPSATKTHNGCKQADANRTRCEKANPVTPAMPLNRTWGYQLPVGYQQLGLRHWDPGTSCATCRVLPNNHLPLSGSPALGWVEVPPPWNHQDDDP